MAQRPRLLKPLVEKVIQLNKQYRFIKEGDNVLLALSGGPDSVFLLHILTHLQQQFKLQIGAAHVNHGLRGAAAKADEAFCLELCSRLGITLHVKRVQLKKIAEKENLSVEEAGRKVRYAYLQGIKKKHQYSVIATAHNLDDNLESVIMALCSGTGIGGLQGIAPVLNGVVRPILNIRKADIMQYLDTEKIAYCTDESNREIHFRRNFIRHKITPLIEEGLNPNAAEAVMRLSEAMRGVRSFLDEQVQLGFLFATTGGKGKCSIQIAKMDVLHPFIQTEVVKKIAVDYLGTTFTGSDISSIISLGLKQKGRELRLSQGVRALKESEEIIIMRQNDSPDVKNDSTVKFEGTNSESKRLIIERIDEKDIILGRDKLVEYIDAEKLTGTPALRKWQSGDTFFPIGMQGRKKVSDFLTNLKISRFEREQIEVVDCDGEIVWIAGKRLDRRFKLTEKTKIIYKMTYRADGKNTN